MDMDKFWQPISIPSISISIWIWAQKFSHRYGYGYGSVSIPISKDIDPWFSIPAAFRGASSDSEGLIDIVAVIKCIYMMQIP